MRNCSLSLTTFVSFATLSALVKCISCCGGSCGATLTSPCTWARRKCGIELGSNHRLARRCSAQLFWLTPRPECGEEMCPVQAKLIAKHRVFLDRIPAVNDLQSAWLLLTFCAATRANFSLRSVSPELALEFAVQHDTNVWQCFCNSLGFNHDQFSDSVMAMASLPLRLGGLGMRSAEGSQAAAHWASWADALAMIHARHPAVANTIVRDLDASVDVPIVRELQRCEDILMAADFRGAIKGRLGRWPQTPTLSG